MENCAAPFYLNLMKTDIGIIDYSNQGRISYAFRIIRTPKSGDVIKITDSKLLLDVEISFFVINTLQINRSSFI